MLELMGMAPEWCQYHARVYGTWPIFVLQRASGGATTNLCNLLFSNLLATFKCISVSLNSSIRRYMMKYVAKCNVCQCYKGFLLSLHIPKQVREDIAMGLPTAHGKYVNSYSGGPPFPCPCRAKVIAEISVWDVSKLHGMQYLLFVFVVPSSLVDFGRKFSHVRIPNTSWIQHITPKQLDNQKH